MGKKIKELEVDIKGNVIIDDGETKKQVNKVRDDIENTPAKMKVEFDTDTKSAIKSIENAIKELQGRLNGNGLKVQIDYKDFENSFSKIENSFKELAGSVKEGINPEIDLSGLNKLTDELNNINSVLSQIANKSKTSFQLKEQKNALSRDLKSVNKSLRETHRYMFEEGDSGRLNYNIDTVNFKKQAADVLKVGKKTEKELQQLFNNKKTKAGFSNSFYELVQGVSGHLSNGGNLNTKVKALPWSDTAQERKSAEAYEVTIKELVDSLHSMFQSVRKDGESLDDTLTRIFDDPKLKQRNISSGVFKDMFKSADLMDSINILDKEISEAEARETKFSANAIKDIESIAKALKEFIGDGQGLDKITQGFEELLSTIRELSNVLNEVDFSKASASASKSASKAKKDVSLSTEEIMALRKQQLESLSKRYDYKDSKMLSQTDLTSDGRFSYVSSLRKGQQELTNVSFTEDGEMNVNGKLMTSYKELEKIILNADTALLTLKEDLKNSRSVGTETKGIEELIDNYTSSREEALEILKDMAKSDDYRYEESNLESLKKEREENLRLAKATKQAKEERKEYNKTLKENQTSAKNQQKKIEEDRLKKIKEGFQKEKEIISLEKELNENRTRLDRMKTNNADSTAIKDQEDYLNELKRQRENAFQSLRDNPEYDDKQLESFKQKLGQINDEREKSIKIANADAEAQKKVSNAEKEAAREAEKALKESERQSVNRQKAEDKASEKIQEFSENMRKMASSDRYVDNFNERLENTAKIFDNINIKGKSLEDINSVLKKVSSINNNVITASKDTSNQAVVKDSKYDLDYQRSSSSLSELKKQLDDLGLSTNQTNDKIRDLGNNLANASSKADFTNAINEIKTYKEQLNGTIETAKESERQSTNRQKAEDKASEKIQEFSENMRKMSSSGEYVDNFNNRLENTAKIFDNINIKGKSLEDINSVLKKVSSINNNVITASKDTSNQAVVKDSKYDLDYQRSSSSLSELKKQLDDLGLSTNQTNDKIRDLGVSLANASSKADFTNAINEIKTYKEQLNGTIETAKELNGLQNTYADYINKIGGLKSDNSTKAFGQKIESTVASLNQFDYKTAGLTDLKDKVEKVGEEFKKLEKEAEDAGNVIANQIGVDKINSNIQKFLSDNTSLSGTLRKQLENLQIRLEGTEVTKADLNEIVGIFAKIRTEAYRTGQVGATVFDTLRGRIKQMSTNFVAMYFSFYDVARYIRETVSAVTEINSAMIELRKVSDESQRRIEQDFKISAKSAQDLGSTVKDVINITADWSRLGYTIDEAEELARVTTMFKTVGDDMTAESASEAMISTLKGYDIEVDKAQYVLDQYNEVANNFAIDTQGLSASLERSGAALHAAGNDIAESMGLIVAANDSLQDPASVGTMLKTISMRLRGASVSELEDLGIDTEGMSQGVKSVVKQFKAQAGIDIMEGTDYKSTFKILDELHDKWADLNDAERAALTEAVAGKRGGSVMSSLMENWEDARKAMETAQNAEGSAERELEHASEGVEFSINRIKASAEELAYDVLDSGFLKNVLEFINSAVRGLDDLVRYIGPGGTITLGLTTIAGILNADKLVKGFSSLADTGRLLFNLQQSVQMTSMGNNASIVADTLLKGTTSFWAKDVDEILDLLSMSGGNKELAERIAILKGVDEAQIQATLSAHGFAESQTEVAGSSAGLTRLSEAYKGLAASLGMSTTALTATLGAVAALAVVIGAVAEAQKAVNEIGESSGQFAEQYSSTSKEIQSYKEEIISLQETIHSSNSSYDESKQARERLYEIQSALIKNYGSEKESIDNITDAINGEVDALDTLTEKQWQRQVDEFNRQNVPGWDGGARFFNGVNNNVELMQKKIEGDNGEGVEIKIRASLTDKGFLDQMAKLHDGIVEVDEADHEAVLHLKGNAYDLMDSLDDIQIKANEAGDSLTNRFKGSLADETRSLSNLTEQWRDFYKLYRDNSELKNAGYDTQYSDYKRQIEEYKEIFANPESTEEDIENSIKKVKNSYDKIAKSIESNDSLGSAVKTNILSAFDDLSPELINKFHELDFSEAFNNDTIVSSVDKTFKGLAEEVRGNFDFSEDILHYDAKAATEEQKAAYGELSSAATEYKLSIEELTDLLVKRNELESKADTEYAQKIKESFRELASIGGVVSESDFNEMFGQFTTQDWKQAAEDVNEYKKQFGLLVTEVQKLPATYEEAKNSANEFLKGNDKISSELEDVKAVLADVKNVDQATYTSLISHSKSYTNALTIQNGRLTVNKQRLTAVANSRVKEQQQTLKQVSAYKKLEYLKRYRELKMYDEKLVDTTSDTYDQISALQQQITELDMLCNSLEQASDAFDRFKEAQQTEDSPDYNTSQEAYKAINEGLESGFVGTDDFKTAQQLLYSADAYREFTEAAEQGYDAQRQFAENWQKEHEKFFTDDDFKNVQNFYDALKETGLLDNGQIASSEDIGKKLGLSKDSVNSLVEKLNLLDFDDEVLKQSPVDFIDHASQAIGNKINAKEALNEALENGADSNLLTSLEEDVKKAETDYDAFMNRIPETFAETKEKMNTKGISFAEALYGSEDGLTTVQSANALSFLETLGIGIDDLQNKMAQSKADGTLFDPTLLNQLIPLYSTLSEAMYEERADDMSTRIEEATKAQTDLKKAQDELNALQEQKKTHEKTGEGTAVSDDQIAAAQAKVDGLRTALDELVNEDFTIELQLDDSAINSQISALETEISGLEEKADRIGNSHVTLDSHAQAAKTDLQNQADEKRAQVDALKEQSQQIETIVNFKSEGYDAVTSDIDSIPDSKDVSVNFNANTGQLDAAKAKYDALHDKQITIGIGVKGGIPSLGGLGGGGSSGGSSGAGEADGTAHAKGTDWTLPSNEKGALVGELGTEGLVRDGKFYLIGQKGPERKDLKKGDIIFNHKQTEELLNNGYTTERGELVGSGLVDGTVVGTAHSQNTNYANLQEWTFKKGSSTSAKSAAKEAKEATDDIKDDIDETEEKAEEASDNFIDWIERRIKKVTLYAERYANQAQKALDKVTNTMYSSGNKGVKAFKNFDSTINSLYKTATNAQKQVMKTQSEAYTAYTNLTNAVGLDPEYQKRIKDGLMEIENIGDQALSDQIQKYQDYYDKSQDALDSFIEAADKFYHMPIDKAAEKIENLSNKIEYLDKVSSNAVGAKAQNDVLDEQDRQQKQTLKAYEKSQKQTQKSQNNATKKAKATALKESKQELKDAKKDVKSKKVLSTASKKAQKEIKKATADNEKIDLKKLKKGTKAYKSAKNYNDALADKNSTSNAIKYGNVLNIADYTPGTKAFDAVVKYNAAVNANTEAWNNLKNAEEDYLHWHNIEFPKAKFDNVATQFEHAVDMMNHDFTDYQNKINELQKSGQKISTGYYKAQKQINEGKLAEYEKERTDLEDMLPGIKQYSEEWYQAYDKIKEVDNAISSLKINQMELNEAIRDMYFNSYDSMKDDIQTMISEQEFLIGLRSHSDKTDKEIGEFTDTGRMNLSSDVAQAVGYRAKADTTGSVVKTLQNNLSKGILTWNDTTFDSVEQLEEEIRKLYSTWQSEIKDTYQAESAVVDLMKEKYQAELDMYKDLISSKKDALSAEKDLYEYQKKLAEKTKDITQLEKQLAAYAGDTSQEGQAKRQRLSNDLEKAQSDLKDTEYDRRISDEQKMLDDLIGEYEEKIEKKLKDFDGLLREGVEQGKASSKESLAELQKIAENNGYIPMKLNDIESSASSTASVMESFFNGVYAQNTQSILKALTETGENTIPGALNNLGITLSSAIQKANAVSTDSVNSVKTVNGKSATANNAGNDPNVKPSASASTTTATTNKATSSTNSADSKLKTKVLDWILGNSTTGHEPANGKTFSDVNAKISKLNKTQNKAVKKQKVLSTAKLKELAKIVGVKYDNASKSGNLYKALKNLKISGFSKGGLVSGINKIAIDNGDDALATVKVGEAILTPTDSKNLASLADKFETIDVTADIMNMLKNGSKNGGVIGAPQNIDYGGVQFNFELPNVTDSKSFINAIQKDTDLQKAIQSVSVDRINNGGRLSVNRIK